MSPLLVVVLAIVLVVGMLVWLGALADASDYPAADFVAIGRTKRATITFIALTLAVGGVWYWLRVRGGLRRVARASGDPAEPV
ncbi:MAG: hypothetical protein ACXVKA_00845 [Acidimicrobiia bacterium]